jgi:transglutaminase-like putative cysteine protease
VLGRASSCPALVATTAAAAWALAHQTLVPAVLLVTPLVVGAAFSWRRWGAGRRVRPELVALGVAALVFVTGGLAEPHRLAAVVAGCLALGLVVLSFDWTSPDRVRLSLLVSLAVQVGATSELGSAGAVLRLLVWSGLAATAMSLLHDLDQAAVAPDPPGSAVAPDRRTARRRRALDLGAFLVLAALATAVGTQLDLDPPREAIADPGDPAGEGPVAAYLGFSDELDTSVRGEPGDAVVLRVQAAAPDFWRGQTFDAWDGRVWRRSTGDNPLRLSELSDSPSSFWVPPMLGDEGWSPTGEPFVQRFEVVAPRSDLLFGAYRIEEVDVAATDVLAENDGTLRVTAPLGPGASYTVVSRRSEVTATALRAADPSLVERSQPVGDAYLALGEVPGRVEALAREVTAEAPTTYDKVKALEAWMGANTTYTRDIPPLPPGADAVDHHLFVDRRGYCEQIGTSLVVMLRSLGIPARLAVGYVPGEQSLLGGEFTVRADDGHAWAEVYFPGLGWQGFDPTASVPLSGEHDRSLLASLLRLLRRLAPVVVAVTVVVVALALRGAWSWQRRRRARPWAAVYFGRLQRVGKGRGRARQPHETPGEYVAALAASVLPDPRLPAVGDIVTEAAWSGRVPAPGVTAWADSVLSEATRRWPAARFRRPRGCGGLGTPGNRTR